MILVASVTNDSTDYILNEMSEGMGQAMCGVAAARLGIDELETAEAQRSYRKAAGV